MVEVVWHDTWEPVDGCQIYSNFDTLYAEFDGKRRERNAGPRLKPPPKRQDLHLDHEARVGLGRDPPVAPNTAATLRSRIRIATSPINPDMDIVADSKHYSLLRAVHTGPDVQTEVCHSYDPTGRYIGTLTWDRLEQLHVRYHAASTIGTANYDDIGLCLSIT
jgi:hypothetical protein